MPLFEWEGEPLFGGKKDKSIENEPSRNNSWIIIVLLIVGAFYAGRATGDPNKSFIYGDTGAPRNCRAIIAENIEGWHNKVYSAEEALDSIERNCGAEGYSWGLR